MTSRTRLPKLEVLLPFHKVDNLLMRAIDSTLASNQVEIRILLIDDRLEKRDYFFIPKKYVDRIEVISNNFDHGYGPALREGTKFISNPFVGLMNSDDEIHPDRFRLQLEQIGDADISITRMERRRIDRKKSVSLIRDFPGQEYFPELLLFGAYGANATWTMRSHWWKQNAFFDASEALDWRIALKSFKDSKISFVNQPLYFYSRHRNQATQKVLRMGAQDFKELFSEWKNYFKIVFNMDVDFDTFQVLAAPWLKTNRRVDIQHIKLLADSILEKLEKDSESKSEVAFVLMQRRFVLAALRNDLQFRDRVKLLNGTKKEVIDLFSDILSR